MRHTQFEMEAAREFVERKLRDEDTDALMLILAEEAESGDYFYSRELLRILGVL